MRTTTRARAHTQNWPLEPPQRAQISVVPTTDAAVDAVRRWHDDEGHPGAFEFCRSRPCGDVTQAVRP